MKLKWIDYIETDGICIIFCKMCDVSDLEKVSKSPVVVLLKSEKKLIGERLGTEHTNLPLKLSSCSSFFFFSRTD